MTPRNYYNDNDPGAVAWIRKLIRAGLVPDGEVDDRPIENVRADELAGFTQCHFFAGIAGWPLALALAGWPADRPVWTGSCPCQPFSGAGKGRGTDDPRHLWPEFFRLIRECQPPAVFGEQVDSPAGRQWLSGVFADLESARYAVAGAGLPAAGVGAPHIRQRLWWGADAGHRECWRPRECGPTAGESPQWQQEAIQSDRRGANSGLAFAERNAAKPRWVTDESSESFGTRPVGAPDEPRRHCVRGRLEHPSRDGRQQWRAKSGRRGIASGCGARGLGHATGNDERWPRESGESDGRAGAIGRSGAWGDGRLGDAHIAGLAQRECNGGIPRTAGCAPTGQSPERPGNPSAWSEHIWLPCLDGKTRRIKPGIEPLAHGVSGRVGLLRGYGNAIVPPVAAKFIQAFLESETI